MRVRRRRSDVARRPASIGSPVPRDVGAPASHSHQVEESWPCGDGIRGDTTPPVWALLGPTCKKALSIGGLSSGRLEEGPEPVAARLDRASLRREVDVHEPEPPAVPPRPLEVVHQAPHEAVSYTHLRAHETVLDLVC